MIYSKLPDAIMREREAMLMQAAEVLLQDGHTGIHLNDTEGYPEPEIRTINVLNIHLQPDLEALFPNQAGPTIASIEVSSDLGEESCGRRWQALNSWAKDHEGRYRIFIHPEDQQRAREIARIWQLDENLLEPLFRH